MNAYASLPNLNFNICRVSSAGRIQILRTGRHNDVGVHLASDHDIVARPGFGGLDGECAVRVDEEVGEQVPGLWCKTQPNAELVQRLVQIVLAAGVLAFHPELTIARRIAGGVLHVVLARRVVLKDGDYRSALVCISSISNARNELLDGWIGMLRG